MNERIGACMKLFGNGGAQRVVALTVFQKISRFKWLNNGRLQPSQARSCLAKFAGVVH